MSEGLDLLTSLPATVTRHMLGFLGDCQSLLRLERTCRSLRDLMRDGETWTELVVGTKDVEFERATSSYRERVCILNTLRCIRKFQQSTHNIILDCFGGAEGIRQAISSLLERMASHWINFVPPPSETDLHYWAEVRDKKPEFRGDTVFYLVEVIQAYMICRLKHVNTVTLHSQGHLLDDHLVRDYPTIYFQAMISFDLAVNARDDLTIGLLRASVAMNSISMNTAWGTYPLPTSTSMTNGNHTAAGIVKIDSEALDMVATEVHFLLAELAAFSLVRRVSYKCVTERSGGLNYYAINIPYERGPVVTVLPGHVQDAAISRGMDPLLGLGMFGVNWAPRTNDSLTKEVQEALKAYERPDEWESESDSWSEPSLHSSESESDCTSVLDMDVDWDINATDLSGSTGN
ncbi:hypothetical protein THAOC_31352 [Thalassiosira oceanica]|uniref:F-box domain-containing protein n=1 Tax=Thalassiosira oceanica TaxID=159749 RepID=K0RBW9_THAOC|nr:hypothetical protein THAOC_31352 [Thalassiosira oceanica]|eukprot:EJK49739.1 hypothetical protein THAOC_31352 [Thalassiosira oceanica]